jgi:hypothetical protein
MEQKLHQLSQHSKLLEHFIKRLIQLEVVTPQIVDLKLKLISELSVMLLGNGEEVR